MQIATNNTKCLNSENHTILGNSNIKYYIKEFGPLGFKVHMIVYEGFI